MTEKELKSEITKKIQQGTSKSDLYDQFKDNSEDEALRKILASKPSFELRMKFKRTHLFLSIIWGSFILLELFSVLDLIVNFDLKLFISIIVSIYLAVNIWRFDGRFFLPGIIWFTFTIFNVFKEIFNLYEYDPDFDIIFIISASYGIILVLGIYLMYDIRKNVFGYFKWFQPELDKNNKSAFE